MDTKPELIPFQKEVEKILDEKRLKYEHLYIEERSSSKISAFLFFEAWETTCEVTVKLKSADNSSAQQVADGLEQARQTLINELMKWKQKK